MRDVIMPSGAVLRVNAAPFKDSKLLWQEVLAEFKGVPFNSEIQISEIIKDLACTIFASKKIELALWNCAKRSLYNDAHVQEEIFEDAKARDDFMAVCTELLMENISPFLKGLYAQSGAIIKAVTSGLSST